MAEVTFSNSVSVAEHAVMMILSLVRNYLPAHEISAQGGWNIADCVQRSYDLEGMHVGSVAAAIKVVREEIPTIDTCVSFNASYAARPATSHAWTASSRPKTRTSDLSSWLTRMQSPR